MSKKLSRRFFLQSSLAGLSSIGISNLATPSVSFGQAQSGGSKFVVHLQLLGGIDPMLILPYTSEYAALASLRGDYARINPNTGVLGIHPKFGLHPNLAVLYPYLNRTRIFLHTGNALHLSPDRSHEIATLRMVLGGSPEEVGRKGWMARLYEQNKANLIGFGGPAETYLCDKCAVPPLVTTSYEKLDIGANIFAASIGGQTNAKDVEAAIKKLSKIEGPSEMDNKWRTYQRSMFEGLDQTKTTLSYTTPQSKVPTTAGVVNQYEVVPTSLTAGGTYWANVYKALGNQYRNIAQTIMRAKVEGKNDRVMMVLAQGGFDAHDTWLQNGNMLMGVIGGTLKVFLDDLASMQLLDSTVVLITSEFGRTVAGNGTGTDHGIGYPSFVIGGKVNGLGNTIGSGIYGDPLTAAQLNTYANYKNAWPAEVAQESIIAEIVKKHLGVDPSLIFPEEILKKQKDLDIFKA